MAWAIHKTTMQLLDSVDGSTLDPEVWHVWPKGVTPEGITIPRAYRKLVEGEIVEQTDAEKLPAAKSAKRLLIDVETQEAIYAGFTFDGHHFSLSDNAQRNWLALAEQVRTGNLALPYSVSTSSDTQYLLTGDQFSNFIAAAFTKPSIAIGTGRLRKSVLEAATTLAEVEAA